MRMRGPIAVRCFLLIAAAVLVLDTSIQKNGKIERNAATIRKR